MFGTRSARYGQLLLFAALLFGIFTMHTVGHPAEHGGPGGGAAPMAAEHSMTAPGPAAGQVTQVPEAAHPGIRHPVRPAPMRGMDPMAVCLAVLTVWGLALLTALMAARRPANGVPGTAGARSPRLPRPPPPPRPRKALLTSLSVLRI